VDFAGKRAGSPVIGRGKPPLPAFQPVFPPGVSCPVHQGKQRGRGGSSSPRSWRARAPGGRGFRWSGSGKRRRGRGRGGETEKGQVLGDGGRRRYSTVRESDRSAWMRRGLMGSVGATPPGCMSEWEMRRSSTTRWSGPLRRYRIDRSLPFPRRSVHRT
jgi:hypothetical protein